MDDRGKLSLSKGDIIQSSKYKFAIKRRSREAETGHAKTESDGINGKKWRGIIEYGDRWRKVRRAF